MSEIQTDILKSFGIFWILPTKFSIIFIKNYDDFKGNFTKIASSLVWYLLFENVSSMYSQSPLEMFVTMAAVIPHDMDAMLQQTWVSLNNSDYSVRCEFLNC